MIPIVWEKEKLQVLKKGLIYSIHIYSTTTVIFRLQISQISQMEKMGKNHFLFSHGK